VGDVLIALSFKDLRRSILKSFCCASCSLNRKPNVSVEVTKQTIRLATTIMRTCKNGHETQILPEGRYTNRRKNGYSKPFIKRFDSIADYNINYNLVLSMISNGLGFSILYKILSTIGFLTTGLHVHNYTRGWESVQQDIFAAIEKVSNETLVKNLDEEILLSATNEKGCGDRVPIKVSCDAGWQKRSSGNKYDSGSSHCLMVGAYSSKVVAFETFSKFCRKCNILATNEEKIIPTISNINERGKSICHEYKEIKEFVPKHINCSKNFEGSSKSMEAYGNLLLVTRIFNTKKAWVQTFISDDDSTSRSALKHCYKDKVNAGLMVAAVIPKRIQTLFRTILVLVPSTNYAVIILPACNSKYCL
jgi:hypothetical protein